MSGESWCMACGATVPALTLHSWDDCVRNHEKRIAKLEAQLGAVTSGVVPVSAADCSGSHTTPKQGSQQAGESGSGSAAAPSVIIPGGEDGAITIEFVGGSTIIKQGNDIVGVPNIQSLIDGLKALESQLVAVIGSKAQASEATARRQEAVAAPNLSAEQWKRNAELQRSFGLTQAEGACRLAAAVTEVYERTQHLSIDYDTERMRQFTRLVLAFCRGEKLQEVPNG